MDEVVSALPSSFPPGGRPGADLPSASPHQSGTNFTVARSPLESSPPEGQLSEAPAAASEAEEVVGADTLAQGELAQGALAQGELRQGTSGQGRSWGELYRDHADFVWRCLRRMGLDSEDAADALHEVFLIVHRREAAFDSSKGTERGWLFGISANVVRAERRKKRPSLHADGQEPARSYVAPTGDIVGEASWRAADGAGIAAGEQLKAALKRAIDDLSPEHRAVFTMFEIEGADCQLIADELEVPVGTVYSRLHKARETLRSALAEFRTAAARGSSLQSLSPSKAGKR